MDKQTFLSLAESYGGDLTRWPEDQRQSASEALLAHPEWQAMLTPQQTLDDLLDKYQVTMDLNQLEANILQRTTETTGLLDKLLNWLSPDSSLWRPALAATVPILVGVMIGTSVDLGFDEQYQLSEELEYIQYESSYASEIIGGGEYN